MTASNKGPGRSLHLWNFKGALIRVRLLLEGALIIGTTLLGHSKTLMGSVPLQIDLSSESLGINRVCFFFFLFPFPLEVCRRSMSTDFKT